MTVTEIIHITETKVIQTKSQLQLLLGS